MNAAEHYETAALLVTDANDQDADSPWRASLLAEAQVHATLALVAVQADACAVAAASAVSPEGVVGNRAVMRRMSFTDDVGPVEVRR